MIGKINRAVSVYYNFGKYWHRIFARVGLRGSTQVRVFSNAWVRIPQDAQLLLVLIFYPIPLVHPLQSPLCILFNYYCQVLSIQVDYDSSPVKDINDWSSSVLFVWISFWFVIWLRFALFIMLVDWWGWFLSGWFVLSRHFTASPLSIVDSCKCKYIEMVNEWMNEWMLPLHCHSIS